MAKDYSKEIEQLEYIVGEMEKLKKQKEELDRMMDEPYEENITFEDLFKKYGVKRTSKPTNK